MADPAAMEKLVAKVQAELGPISILVNNAGIGADRAVTEEINEAMYDKMFDVHVKGTFFTTRAVLPGMKSYGSGAIVNISSIWGMVGHHFGIDLLRGEGGDPGLYQVVGEGTRAAQDHCECDRARVA